MNDSPSRPVLSIRGLRKRFGAREVLCGLDLEVASGEIFAFLGPNGAGKTTALRLVAGILTPTHGAITIDGIDLAKDPLGAKRITGFVPDRPFLYPRLTGRETLALVCSLYGCPERMDDGTVEKFLDRFDLAGREDDYVEGYSLGMRQKLALLAGLLPAPRLLLVDEPLIGLDPPAAREVKEVFKETAAAGGTVFLSTHLLEIAEALADRVAILDRGEVVAVGRLDELRAERDERLEEVFLRLIADRREDEDPRWSALLEAARRERRKKDDKGGRER